MDPHSPFLVGHYDYRLVALSVLIAIFAAYAALDLAGRVTAARGVVRFVWLSCGAFAMGTGIWSMHYMGMEAFRLPVAVEYDWPTVFLSMAAAILASAVALYVVSRKTMSLTAIVIGSVLMGGGIAAMHYIGMEAMRLPAMCAILALLESELSRSVRQQSPVSVLLCDVDPFKKVNDSYGRMAGDQVLQAISTRLLSAVRSHDVVGRYGGEEFLIVLGGCDGQNLRLRAEQVRRSSVVSQWSREKAGYKYH